jgi:hypothetical protein
LENYRIFKISNTTEKPAKTPLRVLSELNYVKAAFLKEPGKKQCRLVWLLTFSKAIHFKSQTKHSLNLSNVLIRV